MTTNKPFLYSIAFLSLTIPVPGRFIFGLVLAIELILLEAIGIIANSIVIKLKFQEIKSYFVMAILIASTILFRQIFHWKALLLN